jgi:hypothetical protein
MTRVAAVQLEVALADIPANLDACEALARDAAQAGAQVIALPEFFTTGAAFIPELAHAALSPDGAATEMLLKVGREEGVLIGGSYLCRDPDGEVRNAYFLAGPDGLLEPVERPSVAASRLHAAGRGRQCNDRSTGAEGLRTIRRRTRRHAAITGAFSCPMPELPILTYRGHFEGGAQIADADGKDLARRERTEPNRFWLHRRGALAAATWNTQRVVGRRWYARNLRSRAPGA